MVGRFYLVGIFIGLTAGTVAALVGGAIAGFLFAFAGIDLRENPFDSMSLILMLLVVTSISFIITGFVTARHSPGGWIFDVGATGFVLLFLSAAALFDSGNAIFPFWFNLSMFLLSVPLVLVGGRLYSRRWRVN